MPRFKRYLAISLMLSHVLVIMIWWWRSSGATATSPTVAWLALGRLAGLLAASGALLQLLMMAKIRPIEQLLPYTLYMQVHKWVGYTVFTMLLLHPWFLVLGYKGDQASLMGQFVTLVSDFHYVFYAFIGWLLFIAIVVSSISFSRKRLPYEYWYALHTMVYVAVGLSALHQTKNGAEFVGHPLAMYYWYGVYGLVFGLIGWYRFVRPVFNSWRYDLRVAKVLAEGQNIYSVYISGRNLQRLEALPGQFFNWQFLARGLWWEAHPFSLSAIPSDTGMRFTFKVLGDYTAKLPQVRVGSRLIIDGPHGSLFPPASHKKLLLIGGGSGITPFKGIVEALPADTQTTVIHSFRGPAEQIFTQEFAAATAKSHLRVHYLDTTTNPRLNTAYLQRVVPDITEYQVYICGPLDMMQATAELLTSLGVPSGHIHREGFTY